ncbi:class II glutamine amidotransferase [Herbidospora mongoliensis]|uniref:class II glutamine amidotransferase n=1 Tax=Herbidospora mongoliensis TaxID=688067 RepID=UPI000831FF0E|nr:class II glutamine amidotransferase [Herbidospora mongoliensis]
MCRLFGLTAAPHRTKATFWLLDAPDSLTAQSHHDPDGAGLGYFADGEAHTHKAPIAAYEDRCFAEEAKQESSTTFIAHVRYASTGGLDMKNTHPFEQDNRLFAHNGVVEGLDRMEARLGPDRSLVKGDTDSERVFALITSEIRANGGDVTAAITTTTRWIAEQLPLFALNLILITDRELWALRYPETHRLYVLERPPAHLRHEGTEGRIRVHSADLATMPCVVVASERMDADPGWRLMEPGELLHVDGAQRTHKKIILPDPPRHQMSLRDLRPEAAASQHTA